MLTSNTPGSESYNNILILWNHLPQCS